MQFTGIDLHTNRFTCCYRDGTSSPNQKAKRTETFDLTEAGLAAFYMTLTGDTCVLVEATITTFSFVRLFRHRVRDVIIANTCELKKAGLVRRGLRRRVFAEIFQMLRKQEYHYGREAEKHEMKMRHYKQFLEKNNEILEKNA